MRPLLHRLTGHRGFDFNTALATILPICVALTLRADNIPEFGIERAVRLCWPIPAGVTYFVEAAPTVQGPWLPAHNGAPPGMQQITVPAGQSAEFYRLRETP